MLWVHSQWRSLDRVQIYRSAPPSPPHRSDAKISVVRSQESVG
jgi:hypothetical protein